MRLRNCLPLFLIISFLLPVWECAQHGLSPVGTQVPQFEEFVEFL